MTFAYEKHVPSRAEIVIGMLGDAWRHRRDQREFARLVEDCPTEADRLARDLNIDRAGLAAIVRQGREQSALLKRRLRILGIDADQVRRTEPGVSNDLHRCCALCGVKARCTNDMVRRPQSAAWRTYCPNVQTIEALQAGQDASLAAR